jgi:aminopeptidase N
MEHQTMTSTTTFEEDVISHELVHQWFGDMITCRTWADLWLNEGFAQYCSGLFREKEYGASSYQSYMNSQMSLAVQAVGAIGVPDTSSVRNLFDGPRMYNKGSTVLHMLRHVLGDSIFFRSLRTYANSPTLKYSTATIRDFQNACENVSGKNLEYFFREWIFGEGFPNYGYAWSSTSTGNGYLVTIDLQQSVTTGNPAFFTMPVDFRISAAGWDTIVTFFNDSLTQRFAVRVSTKPATVLIDPDGWLLKLAFSEANQPPGQYSLEQNYPNPFNPKTTIAFRVPVRSFVTLEIYDILGRLMTTLVNEQRTAGLYTVDWSSSNASSGVYIYRLTAHSQTGTQRSDFVQVKKMVLVR